MKLYRELIPTQKMCSSLLKTSLVGMDEKVEFCFYFMDGGVFSSGNHFLLLTQRDSSI